MKAVIQRVDRARVLIDGTCCGEIDVGLLVFLGVEKRDGKPDIDRLVEKIAGLRVFEDGGGRMNRSVLDIRGSVLVVSQFTIAGSIEKGRRPSFDNARDPETAERMVQDAIDGLKQKGLHVESGRFGAMMKVELVNNGPATFIYDREGGA